VRELDSQCADR